MAFDNGGSYYPSEGVIAWQIQIMNNSPLTGKRKHGEKNHGRQLNVVYETHYGYVI